ncbi:MAG: ribosome maturation factor RimM [Defluviitaleaceae bacterium]|nr:ribosome maturation factor RimM [Defluviitaleaceae bacterium]
MSYFEIGIITKAQGIRGELRVLPTTDEPTRFEQLIGSELILRKKNGETAAHRLSSARVQKNIVILKLDEINERNEAEKLLNTTICIPPEAALPLQDGEYYIRDLIGLYAETENGEKIGELTRVLHTGANDVYVITPPKGEGDPFMIPAAKNIVKEVRLDEKKIVLQLLDGMRELTI